MMAVFVHLLGRYYTVGLAVLLLLLALAVWLFARQWPLIRDYGQDDSPSNLDAVGIRGVESHRYPYRCPTCGAPKGLLDTCGNARCLALEMDADKRLERAS